MPVRASFPYTFFFLLPQNPKPYLSFCINYNKQGVDKLKPYKVCVYAICKNEEQFVKRFMKSVKGADLVLVGDTGSTDHSVKKLKKYGAKVISIKVDPWRFDVARNMVLDAIPKDIDICICLDLDEVLSDHWLEALEDAWDAHTTRLRYHYNWSFDAYGKPATSFYSDKIHNREYRWTHPVHEVLTYIGENVEVSKICETITVNHYPDKSKSRGQYLPLLELSVEEDPSDDRNMHYLGREYMYYKRWNDAINTLTKHLSLERATWKDERAASMRFIARSYIGLNQLEEARIWYLKAIAEAPYLREGYVELAMLAYREEHYAEIETCLKQALEIKERSKSYINENFCWDSTIYDLLSIAYFYQGKKKEALAAVTEALHLNPSDERIQKNQRLIQDSLSENEQE